MGSGQRCGSIISAPHTARGLGDFLRWSGLFKAVIFHKASARAWHRCESERCTRVGRQHDIVLTIWLLAKPGPFIHCFTCSLARQPDSGGVCAQQAAENLAVI